MKQDLSRRQLLAGGATALAAGLFGAGQPAACAADEPAAKAKPFRFCLNTSTIRGQKLGLEAEIDLTAASGYDAIEPWIGELDKYVKDGGSLKDLDKRIKDKGLFTADVIGFPEWIVDDDARRAKGVEDAKRCMDLCHQISCKHLAAPPVGATKATGMSLMAIADRYRALLELGEKMDVTPQVELWGFSTTLCRLGETAMVAIESGHPKACVLADIYHLYKGGSGFNTLKQMSRNALRVFHLNDYPADPPREKINDANRIYPGDGVAPLGEVYRDLRAIGFEGVLSLELFNPEYWKQDAALVAKTGLEKMKASVEKAHA